MAKLFETNAAVAGELVDMAQKRVVAEKLAGRKGGRIETKLLIADVKEGKSDFSDALVHLADSDRGGQDVILFLAAIADMDEPVVSNAFYQVNEEPIAILCKSLEASVEAYTKLIGLRSEKLKLPLSAAGRSIVHYKELDVTSSRRAMRFVQMRKNLA